MRKLRIPALVGGLTLAAAVALASPGGAPEPASPPPSTPSVPTTDSTQPAAASPARAEAEQSYALAYEEVGKANKNLADGKAKIASQSRLISTNAMPGFRRVKKRYVQSALSPSWTANRKSANPTFPSLRSGRRQTSQPATAMVR